VNSGAYMDCTVAGAEGAGEITWRATSGTVPSVLTVKLPETSGCNFPARVSYDASSLRRKEER